METPKLGVASIFNVQLYKIENASSQSGSNAIKDCFWVSMFPKVPSNPQLTLGKLWNKWLYLWIKNILGCNPWKNNLKIMNDYGPVSSKRHFGCRTLYNHIPNVNRCHSNISFLVLYWLATYYILKSYSEQLRIGVFSKSLSDFTWRRTEMPQNDWPVAIKLRLFSVCW